MPTNKFIININAVIIILRREFKYLKYSKRKTQSKFSNLYL